MRILIIGLAAGLGLLGAGCAGDDPGVRMKVETTDASRSDCRKNCDRKKRACLHKEREDAKREPVDAPKEVSRAEWQRLYKEAQELAKACEEEHRDCARGCLE